MLDMCGKIQWVRPLGDLNESDKIISQRSSQSLGAAQISADFSRALDLEPWNAALERLNREEEGTKTEKE